MERARYLTPAKVDCRYLSGAAYTEHGKLCLISQRHAGAGLYFQPRDPESLMVPVMESLKVKGPLIFLGHAFDHYGHFLLETLPMLSWVSDPQFRQYKFVFLPFPGCRGLLLNQMLRLLSHCLPERAVYLYRRHQVLESELLVPCRPLSINHRLDDPKPYRRVIAQLCASPLVCAVKRSTPRTRRLFVRRIADRVSESEAREAEQAATALGFSVIEPEKLRLEEQLALYSRADVVTGYSGSGLHNVIFAKSSCMLIELGDRRTPKQAGVNQLIANQISGCRHAFVPYGAGSLSDALSSMVTTTNQN